MGDGTGLQDAATLNNVINGTGVHVGTVGGTANVITLTPSPAITAYAAGQTFRFIASGTNTTSVTVAVSGLAAKAVTKNGATALVAGDILSGTIVHITYDGTRFIMGTNTAHNTDAWTPSVGGSATYTSQLGYYYKHGPQVTLICELIINAIGTGSTSVITGAPFAAVNLSAPAACYFTTAVTNVTNVVAMIAAGSQTITLFSIGAAGASLSQQAIFQNATSIKFSLTYLAAP